MFTALRRIGIVAFIAIAFTLGLAGTVYLSLRSPEVSVPEIVGQHYLTGQSTLEGAGLNIRKRARRYKGDAKPDMILDQSPRAGEVVKKGQTVAVVVANEESGDKMPEATGDAAASDDAKPTPTPSPERNSNANTNAAQNENQNRDRRNKNSNKNTNANKNANNQNTNNQNASNRNRNTNNANANANSARNANRNANSDARNRNANTLTINRNANTNTNRVNANRNANTPRVNANRNTNRPTP